MDILPKQKKVINKMITNFSDNAMTILNARYLRKDDEGNVIETPDQMFRRVANYLAGTPEQYEEFYVALSNLEFLPNTPTLVNAGRENAQLSACFVLPVEDSMEGIFDAVKYAALIHKTGGGTGFSFSKLRSKGQRVSTTQGEASGVISFMKVFDAATESVKQGGIRRGANMAMLDIWHPDIEEFITCKDDTTKLNNFNISVAVGDDFFQALHDDTTWDLKDPHSEKVIKTVNARELWAKIVYQAWKNGEPGIIFIDRVNAANPTPWYGSFRATNPCGEQPLLDWESCNLGSINLSAHLMELLIEDEIVLVPNLALLQQTVCTGVDFLNAVLDQNHHPLPQIREATLLTRKIGLGVMGFADMLIKLHIRYDSKEAAELAEALMSFIGAKAKAYSRTEDYHNSTCTTIAPTGTISMLANVSSGIEPNFAWVYTRIAADNTMYMVHPLMEEKLREIGQYNDHILELLGRGVSVVNIPELKELGDYWQLSQEIAPEAHIRIQAAFQKYTDNAVSKTINLPSDATLVDVANCYAQAFTSGCKGVTVYRDGSRSGQVLSFDKVAEKVVEEVLDTIKEEALSDDYICEGCGTHMQRAEGCMICYSCGRSGCS